MITLTILTMLAEDCLLLPLCPGVDGGEGLQWHVLLQAQDTQQNRTNSLLIFQRFNKSHQAKMLHLRQSYSSVYQSVCDLHRRITEWQKNELTFILNKFIDAMSRIIIVCIIH